MKIAIFRGHNTPYNSGAVGILPEEDMINSLSDELIPLLRASGAVVIDCTPDESDYPNIHSSTDSLRIRCEKANSENVDIVVSLHFNYYNGSANGSEIFYVSSSGKSIAEPVLKEIVSLGFTNRGVKKSNYLYVLNHTTAPAILIEGCFCDSSKDISLFDAKSMAQAISRGLVGESPMEIKTPPTAAEAQCDTWAKKKFITDDYKELLTLYYTKCIPIGLNPVILFSQMCIETGYLYKVDSAAGIDASYHNPCGLKTTEGGSNTDPNAHARFDSWDEGIQAHVDHMALYAGVTGYPKSETPDPRHFPYLFGSATTVEALGSTWTTSSTYSASIISFCEEIASTEAETVPPDDSLEELNIKVSQLTQKVALLETSNAQLQNKVEELQSSITGLTSNITALNSKIIPLQDFFDKTLEHYHFMIDNFED